MDKKEFLKTKKSWNLQKFKEKCRILLKNKNIEDIIIFGSAVKGKENPPDVDICLIGEEITTVLIQEIEKRLQETIEVHITKSRYRNLFEDVMLWKTLLHEGYSVKKQQYLAKLFQMQSFFLFTYNLQNLPITKKQIFSHALQGTKTNKGILKQCNGEKIGKSAVLIPEEKAEEMRAFLETWNVVYGVRRVLM